MKLKNKVISLLLVFCLVASLMPTPAFAAGTGKAIQLGTDALSTNVNTTSAAKVYFGKNARNKPYMTYYVIGYKSFSYTHLDVYKRQVIFITWQPAYRHWETKLVQSPPIRSKLAYWGLRLKAQRRA